MTILQHKIVHKVINKDGVRIILPRYTPAGLFNLNIPTNMYAESVSALYPTGAIIEDETSRFHYGRLSANAGRRGRPMFNYGNAAELGAKVGAQVAGATTVPWTCVGTVTENEFSGGYILLQGGYVRRIKSHGAGTAAVAITLTLEDGETIPETIAAGRYGRLMTHPYAKLISREVAAGQKAAHCVGVCTFEMTASYYGWFQSKGYCGVIATPATLGNSIATQAMVPNQVGSEVSVEAAHGYQVIGHTALFDQAAWDNENFIIVDLCIT